jgi:hypothetical protein
MKELYLADYANASLPLEVIREVWTIVFDPSLYGDDERAPYAKVIDGENVYFVHKYFVDALFDYLWFLRRLPALWQPLLLMKVIELLHDGLQSDEEKAFQEELRELRKEQLAAEASEALEKAAAKIFGDF